MARRRKTGDKDAGYENGEVLDVPNVNSHVVGIEVVTEKAPEPKADEPSTDDESAKKATTSKAKAHGK
jgi:hypothetical protein